MKIDSNKYSGEVTRPAATPEPMPTGGGLDVFTEVFKDIEARRQYGIDEYGMPLKTDNGRNTINDLLQEQYDSFVYTKQLQMEIDDETEELENIAALLADYDNYINDDLYVRTRAWSMIEKIIERRKAWRHQND